MAAFRIGHDLSDLLTLKNLDKKNEANSLILNNSDEKFS